ncbi:chromosomal replication initiator protein DnaA [Mycoplasmopsis iners]|uniref:chromosomal replication initiator protein DnaA n=1 Tax=Mycoplasmopsis iners TaxID=76630 RepID=UPI000497905F|nr:chromosomal replication initiator protein DnaA [Mycoplasmopsis iners]
MTKNTDDKITEKSNLIALTKSLLESIKINIQDNLIFKKYLSLFQIVKIEKNIVYIFTNQSNKTAKSIIDKYDEIIKLAITETLGMNYSFKLYWKENIKTKSVNLQTEKEQKNVVEGIEVKKNFSFENYVEGDFNKYAIVLAKRIATGDTEYVPAFIYGKSGLGKTHLLHAIANEAKKNNLSYKIINPSVFTTEISLLLQENNQAKLKKMRNEFNSVDIIMFDDFQILGQGNKKGTTGIVFNILDQRNSDKKMTVFASDRPLELLKNSFDDRMISRIEQGIPMEITDPTQSDLYKLTKFIIEQEKMNPEGWDDESIKFITRNFAKNVRELQKAINVIKFHKQEVDKKLNSKYTLITVKNILSSIQKNKESITPEKIIDYVSKYYKVPKKDIIGKNRTKDVVLARNIAIRIIKEQLKFSLEKIGSIFGNRDHTTILNSLEKIEKLLEDEDQNLKRTISQISDDIYRLN